MKKAYLIQEGTFKKIKNEDITGIDSLVSWKYMGSAEFEFGGLPQSLHRIVDSLNNYDFHTISDVKTSTGDSMRVLCKNSESDDIIKETIRISGEPYGYKEYCHLNDYVLNKLDWDKKHYCDSIFAVNFWWDIDNDFFIFFGKDNQQKVKIAMDGVKKKFDSKKS